MTQQKNLELAKQGNPQAIADLMNRSLQPKGITVSASFTDGCLQILLESDRILNQQNLVTFLYKELMNLGAEAIKVVQVYGQRTGEDFPDWTQELELGAIKPPLLEIKTTVQSFIPNNFEAYEEPGLQEKVRQGDVNAITTLLNRTLEHRGITAKANLQNDCLKLILESAQVPDEKVSITLIRRELIGLRVEYIKTVNVYGREIGEDFPAWTQEFELATPGNSALVAAVEQRSKRSEFLATLQTFKFSSVVPYKQALSAELYNSNTARLLLFFGLFPLAVRLLVGNAGLEYTAWILGIYYSSIWGVVLYNLIKPAQFSWGNTLKCVLFTAFVGIPLLLFISKIPPFSVLNAATQESGLTRVIGFVLGVGVLEELCKALPVYLFLLRPAKLSEPLTSAFYGVMSGLGFAINEGALYSLRVYAPSLITNLVEGEIDRGFGSYVLSNTIRFVSLPLNHAIWAGIVGYFLGLAAINPSRKAPIIFIGVAISAVLHGFHDTFSDNLLCLAIDAFSILLFVAYLRRSKWMVEEMQQAELDYKISNSR